MCGCRGLAQVALGFIGSAAQAGLAEKLGVTGKESKVVSVCNGDLRTAEAFTGGCQQGMDGISCCVVS